MSISGEPVEAVEAQVKSEFDAQTGYQLIVE